MKEADEDGLSFFLVCVCVRVRSRTVFEESYYRDNSDLKKMVIQTELIQSALQTSIQTWHPCETPFNLN